MANGTSELGFIIFISSFLSILTFLMLSLPEAMRFINIFDFAIFGGNIILVAGTCVIATGLPCAVGLGVFAVINIIQYILVENFIIKLLIFTPLTIGIIYVMSRLARGGG